MSVAIPFNSHGKYEVVLIAIKGHPSRFYHYSKTAGEEESWAVRDYLTGQMVRSGDSTMTASQIEALVDDAEEAAYRSVKHARWKDDCQAASERKFGSPHVDSTSPNPATLGRWKRLTF